jgi:hypothetical protein
VFTFAFPRERAVSGFKSVNKRLSILDMCILMGSAFAPESDGDRLTLIRCGVNRFCRTWPV